MADEVVTTDTKPADAAKLPPAPMADAKPNPTTTPPHEAAISTVEKTSEGI